ncbi:phage tail protein [Epilithonimonas arachidiradicis]|uniref:Microcystin-dependent protein n=1 Tax=Epilithonimonas arachidiradicis TaxID=1617282 RepID=A0A420D7R3_9FLAO|nr:tail fiber protein [Epilithonimonas arachidiradicis]RKE86711.1 microcystin-dependent protein [Epilithonimonas arachidiradicis]GGG62525.1 hypothetical protein GCM10007332_25720 [Epilithonimonas arachidiradicis]
MKDLQIEFGQVPMGTIIPFALPIKSLPANWLLCDGSEISANYQSLITLLGSTKTPNLCGRTLIGTGIPSNDQQSDGTKPNFDASNNWPLAYTGGEYKHQLTVDELAKHSHKINGGNFGIHSRSFKGEDDNDQPFETNPSTNIAGTDVQGNDQAHNNMQPYYAVNFIIFAGN